MTAKARKALLALVQKHLLAVWAHPHNYITALVMTVFLFVIGAADKGTVTGAWLFAFVESVVVGTTKGEV